MSSVKNVRLICFSPMSTGPRSAGLNLEMFPLQAALRQSGHEMTVMSPSTTGREWLTARADHESSVPSATRDLALRTPPLPPDLHEGLSLFLYDSVGALFPPFFHIYDFRLLLASHKARMPSCDAVIAFKPWLRTVGPALSTARRMGTRTVLWIDDYDISPKSPWTRKFDIVVVNSLSLGAIYQSLRPLYLPHTIPHSMIAGQSAADSNQNKRIAVLVFFPGTGVSSMYARNVLDALDSIEADFDAIILSLDPRADWLITHLDRLKNKSRFSVLPRISRDEVINLMSQCHAAVVLNSTTRYGRAKAPGRLLECLSRGLPVVVQDNSESGYIVRQGACGIVSHESDPSALSASLARLIEDGALRSRLGRAALIYMRARGDWQDVATSLVRSIVDLRDVKPSGDA